MKKLIYNVLQNTHHKGNMEAKNWYGMPLQPLTTENIYLLIWKPHIFLVYTRIKITVN